MSISPALPDIAYDVKLAFARAFVRSGNASNAAIEVIPEMGKALRASKTLPFDPVVMDEIARIKEDVGEESFLPNKAEFLRKVWSRMESCSATDHENFERLGKLYATVRDFIPKPGMSVNVDARTVNVLRVIDHGTDEEWAAKTARQQNGLVLDAVN